MKKIKTSSEKKIKKILKKAIYICLGIVFLEGILMVAMFYIRETNIDYKDSLNGIIKIDGGYIGVGVSNFRDSDSIDKKIYKHTIKETGKMENIIANQALLVKYDDNFNVIWEKTFKADYDSIFYNTIRVNDGYIVVGSYIYEYEQIDLNTRDGLIVKYDLDGDVVWYKNYQKLGDTEFYNIIQDGDDYIAVGKSIYENFEVGNHYNGGGIIVKYNDKGEVLAENSYGGNKSGLFNSVISVNDGYLVCGRDAANYGIIVKFKKDFNRDTKDEKLISDKVMWHRTYSYMDNAGFTDIKILNNKIYVSGAISVSSNKDSEGNETFLYDAGIVVYDIKGKMLDKYTFGGSGRDRYNSMIIDNDNIVVIGSTDSSDIEIDNYPKYETQTGILVKYDKDGNILYKNYYGGEKEDVFSRIVKIDDKYLVVGTSNSVKGFLGYDYKPILNIYNGNLEKTN